MKCQTHGQNCDGDCVDPNVDNGMMTKIWGPPGWLFLHCVTFGYPYAINSTNPEHKTKAQDYANFFYYLGKHLKKDVLQILPQHLFFYTKYIQIQKGQSFYQYNF